jgi:prepilin-type N-terminal cleavage/methylation domain-containing protein
MAARPTRGDAGFTLIEMIVSMGILLVILGGVFTAMTNAMTAERTARGITTLNGHLRSSMDLVVRDLLQVGQGLPTGRVIGVPNGPGSVAIIQPGPAGDGTCNGVNTFPVAQRLQAVTVGPDLGPAINGQCTDVITTLAHDGAFEGVNVSSIAADGQSLTIYPWGPDGVVNTADDIDISDAPDALGDNIRVGDLLEIKKGNASVLVYVTDVAGQTVTFDPGDPLDLNQFDTMLNMLGTTNQLKVQAPADGDAETVVGGVVQEGPSTASRVRMITYFVDTVTDPASPRLMRQIGASPPNAVAFELEAFRLTYDIADGTLNPAGVRMDAADLAPGGACGAFACSANQIRKANVSIAIRSEHRNPQAGYTQNVLFTQVALRNLSFVDDYNPD